VVVHAIKTACALRCGVEPAGAHLIAVVCGHRLHRGTGWAGTSSYHFYDKIQSSACTTLSTLPRVEMINTALGKCYEKHFIKFHCCLAFNFIAHPALFHSCPALNFIACPALFHWNFILAWPYFIGISFLPRL